jgi:hypothetical protein
MKQYQKTSETINAETASSVQRIEEILLKQQENMLIHQQNSFEHQKNSDAHIKNLNELFLKFMAMQMPGPSAQGSSKRKISDVQLSHNEENILPNEKLEAAFSLNAMETEIPKNNNISERVSVPNNQQNE